MGKLREEPPFLFFCLHETHETLAYVGIYMCEEASAIEFLASSTLIPRRCGVLVLSSQPFSAAIDL